MTGVARREVIAACALVGSGCLDVPGVTNDGAEAPTEMSHSLYVENGTEREQCIDVVVETPDETAVEGTYRIDAGDVVRFTKVLSVEGTTISVETPDHERHATNWTQGNCPHEESYSRNVGVRIDPDGITSVIDDCDVIYAGPYDDVTDASDVERCS